MSNPSTLLYDLRRMPHPEICFRDLLFPEPGDNREPHPSIPNSYRELNPAALHAMRLCSLVGIPIISSSTLHELVYRATILYSLELSPSSQATPDGAVPTLADPHVLIGFTGMAVNARHLSNQEFDSLVRFYFHQKHPLPIPPPVPGDPIHGTEPPRPD